MGRVARQRGQRIEVRGGGHRGGRVVRIIDDDHARARGDRALHPFPVDAEMRCRERNVDAAPARQPDGRIVGVVRGIEDDGLVARADQGLDGRVDGLGAATTDGEFGLGIDVAATAAGDLRGDGGAQRDIAFHRGVLIETPPGRRR
jgi:hypothetical protein